MSLIIPQRKVWTRQPQGLVRIDTTRQEAAGLVSSVLPPHRQNLVRGAVSEFMTATPTVAGREGQAFAGADGAVRGVQITSQSIPATVTEGTVLIRFVWTGSVSLNNRAFIGIGDAWNSPYHWAGLIFDASPQLTLNVNGAVKIYATYPMTVGALYTAAASWNASGCTLVVIESGVPVVYTGTGCASVTSHNAASFLNYSYNTSSDRSQPADGYVGHHWVRAKSRSELIALVKNPWSVYVAQDFPSFSNLAGGSLTLAGENGSLTLTGQSATANTTLVGSEATATLTGQTATTNLSIAGSEATATLTGQDGTFSLTGALTLAGETSDLTLVGQTATANTTFVGSDGALTLTGQTATTNISLVGTDGSVTLTGYDASFVIGGPITLVGETGNLTLTGYDSEFVLSGQTRGGKGKAKIKKRRRLVVGDDNEELLYVIQSLEEEKLALQKLQEKKKKEVVKQTTKELVKVQEVETVLTEKLEEKVEEDKVQVLVLRVETLSQTIKLLEEEIKTLEKQLNTDYAKIVKEVRQLEDLVVVLHNQ